MRRSDLWQVALFSLGLSIALPLWGDSTPETKQRLQDEIKYLASDELEGRGVGSKGLNDAADFIKNQFAKAGLAVDRVDGGAYQKFDMVTGSKLVEPNSLQLIRPDGTAVELKIGTDVEVCSFGGSGAFEAPVVFCGYGIDTTDDPHAPPPAAAEKKDAAFEYNDFAGIDVEGKVVIVMRRNPRQYDPKNLLGAEHGISRFADLRTKMGAVNAYKAAAVLFVNDPYAGRKAGETRRDGLNKAKDKVVAAAEEFLSTPSGDAEKTAQQRSKLGEAVNQFQSVRQAGEKANDDALMKFGYAGNGDSSLCPAFHIPAKLCDEMLASINQDLTKLEAAIDQELKPKSQVVTGWKAKGVTSIEKVRADVSNVIGVIDGSGSLAEETVVIGAHYDHVGRGGQNSLAPGSTEIHNGADDNASGSITLIELARRFGHRTKSDKPARRLVFIAFTGEELGLIGSARYCKQPIFPLEKTVAMLNMDMVGRLRDDKLIIYGVGSSPMWEPELKKLNETAGFKMMFKPEGFGPSDHSSFYAKKIPVLHFFTGEHADYHRPSDDWEKINVDGMIRIADLMEPLITKLIEEPQRPSYVEVKGSGGQPRGGNRPYVGTQPEFGNEEPGYAISGVSPGSPAEKGGLAGGDRIIKFGTNPIKNLDDYDVALRKFAPGDQVEVTVIRNQQEVKLKVTLEPPR